MKRVLISLLLIFVIGSVFYAPPFEDFSGETVTGKIVEFTTKARPGTLTLSCEGKYHYFLIDENTKIIWQSGDRPESNAPAAISDDFWGTAYISVTAGSPMDYHKGHWWNKHDWYHADKITIPDKNKITP